MLGHVAVEVLRSASKATRRAGSSNGALLPDLAPRQRSLTLRPRPDAVQQPAGVVGRGPQRARSGQAARRAADPRDTNSGLSAIAATRLGIPIFHMEAGNRCFDWSVPEEKNRELIDHISDWLLPYTPRSREPRRRGHRPREDLRIGQPDH